MSSRPVDMARYRAAIMALPPLFAQVFVLHCLEELSYEDIALRLQIPIATVEHVLAEALAHIDREID